ncbi:MAG: HAMP domain-containing sensor histidine kinase [Bryobacterales bacterium]|nr:HAMP domain-containing sensor histidine kinase [Bryobacterales bacterium]
MPLQFLGKNRLALVILLCVAMLVLLGALQFAWTGQVSEAQAAMMQNALSNSVRQLEQETERELMFLLSLMRPEGRGGQQLDWSRCAEGYAIWAETTAHAGLLARILVHQSGRDGEASLQELPLGETEPVAAEWDPQLASVERALAEVAGRFGRGRGPFTWTLLPEVSAVVRPIVTLDRLRRGAQRVPRSSGSAFIIVVLDWSYVADEMLPGLIDRLFSGADGERLYEVAIAVRNGENGERFLYRSDPSIDAAWLAGADMRRRSRLFRSLPERPGPPQAGPPGGPDPIRRLALEAGRDERAGEAGGQGQQGGVRPPQGGRGRIVIAGAGAGLGVELAAAHVSGSLAGAVARQRARNLGAGLGVLLLLAGAMALVVVSARRASRLAAMQMEFIAGVSHELRTPLSVICSVGENLADGVVSSAEGAKRYGQLIFSQGRRLGEMVEQTLQFASLESGKRQFKLARIDPEMAVQRAVDQARPMIEQAGFALERGTVPDLPRVRADENALQQILANLISNAVKYGDPGRWIRVEADTSESDGDPEVRIRVCDRGRGIPKEEEERVFDAFYRGAAAGDGNIEGSGLGLKLARDLAQGMGGKLSMRSEPGQGSVFTLHLPALVDAEA